MVNIATYFVNFLKANPAASACRAVKASSTARKS
jgi:hypothetical protein